MNDTTELRSERSCHGAGRARSVGRLARCWHPLLVVALTSCTAPRAPDAAGAERDDAPTSGHAHLGPVTSVAFCGAHVISCSQAGIQWSVSDEVAPAPFRPFALALLPGTDEVVLVGGTPARTGEVAVVARSGARAQRRLGDDCVYAVAVAPDAKLVALGGADGSMHLLALPALDVVRTVHDHTQTCRGVAFTADGSILASCGLDGVVVLRDLARDVTLRLIDHTAGVECLAFRADGARLASGARDGKVRVHAGDGRLLRTFGRLGAEVLALAWRDQTTLLAGLSDGRLLQLKDEGDGARTEITRLGGAVFALATRNDAVAIGGEGKLTMR